MVSDRFSTMLSKDKTISYNFEISQNKIKFDQSFIFPNDYDPKNVDKSIYSYNYKMISQSEYNGYQSLALYGVFRTTFVQD